MRRFVCALAVAAATAGSVVALAVPASADGVDELLGAPPSSDIYARGSVDYPFPCQAVNLPPEPTGLLPDVYRIEMCGDIPTTTYDVTFGYQSGCTAGLMPCVTVFSPELLVYVYPNYVRFYTSNGTITQSYPFSAGPPVGLPQMCLYTTQGVRPCLA